VEVVLDAPTREWSARRNSPTLDLYLYDIREDLRRRENGLIDVHDEAGRVTARRRPPRYYKLSYLVTAWTQRPEDEHRLLSAVLACFLAHDHLPLEILAGRLAGLTLPIPVTVALPPPEDRALSDVWSALGGELKPSLDLVVTSPFEAGTVDLAAELVRESLRVSMGINGNVGVGADAHGAYETVVGSNAGDRGRIFRFRDTTHDAGPENGDPMPEGVLGAGARQRGRGSAGGPSGAGGRARTPGRGTGGGTGGGGSGGRSGKDGGGGAAGRSGKDGGSGSGSQGGHD
jgi:hypothetical protein